MEMQPYMSQYFLLSNLLQLAAVILCLVFVFWFILILCPRVSLLSQCLLWVSPSLGFPPFITSPVLFPSSLTSPVPDPPRWCVCVFSLCSLLQSLSVRSLIRQPLVVSFVMFCSSVPPVSPVWCVLLSWCLVFPADLYFVFVGTLFSSGF